jgi:dienelactone hydrolase
MNTFAHRCIGTGASLLLALAPIASRADDTACREQAVEVLAALDRGDFAAARHDFDARMLSALSEQRLRETWAALPKQLGALDRRGEALVRHADGSVVGVVPLHYAMGWFELQVVCADDGKIDGFWIKPATLAPAEAAAEPVALPDYAKPDRYSERTLSIGDGANALPATLTLPKDAHAVAAVVLVHGSGAHDADETIGPNKPFRDLALGLASRGIAVLRYVKRAAAHPEAYAAGHAFTVDDETVDDALLALKLLRQQAGVDPARTFVLGHSLGAMMAPRIAQRDPALAGAVLLAAPTEPLEDVIVRQVRYLRGASDGGSLDALTKQREQIKQLDPAQAATAPAMMNLPASYWLDLRGYDPVVAAGKLPIPLLVLQGGRDYQVTPKDDFTRWQSTFAHDARVELKTYPTLSHLFMPGGDPPGPQDYQRASHVDAMVIADIAAWIGRRMTATHS